MPKMNIAKYWEWINRYNYDYINLDENDPYNWDILLAELEEFDKIVKRDNLYLIQFELADYLKRYNENKEAVFVEPSSGYKVAKFTTIDNRMPCLVADSSLEKELQTLIKKLKAQYSGKQFQILLPYENWKSGRWTTNEEDANLFSLLDHYDVSQMPPDDIGDPE
ncbi:hypothetical protein RclHR1_09680001 [Rhizophagus clarus]|uniref:Uncharacterized protein n=1 Tax=Rhizophagus clarus TaxID=94130 RepID=A0A2Z6S773_9GLOM|nr:hypothetical protein RclHR1_09680001 [Rhizophagus clarus]